MCDVAIQENIIRSGLRFMLYVMYLLLCIKLSTLNEMELENDYMMLASPKGRNDATAG